MLSQCWHWCFSIWNPWSTPPLKKTAIDAMRNEKDNLKFLSSPLTCNPVLSDPTKGYKLKNINETLPWSSGKQLPGAVIIIWKEELCYCCCYSKSYSLFFDPVVSRHLRQSHLFFWLVASGTLYSLLWTAVVFFT